MVYPEWFVMVYPVYAKIDSWFQNHMRNLGNFKKAVESSKNEVGWCTFIQKIHYFS